MAFIRRRPLESLSLLDDLVGAYGTPRMFGLRALVRETVNDLTGALSDLRRVDSGPQFAIAKARILAKLGFNDAAIRMLIDWIRRTESKDCQGWADGLSGIGGRRFDLRLMGFDQWQETSVLHVSDNIGAIFQHLLALGEFGLCERLVKSEAKKIALVRILDELISIDGLSPIIESGPPKTVVGEAIERIRGWLSVDEGRMLSALASKVPARMTLSKLDHFSEDRRLPSRQEPWRAIQFMRLTPTRGCQESIRTVPCQLSGRISSRRELIRG